MHFKKKWGLSRNRRKPRQIQDCASPLALFDLARSNKSGRGQPHSKTLSRRQVSGMVYSGFVILSSFVIRYSSFSTVVDE
jgi:hypothetical protein